MPTPVYSGPPWCNAQGVLERVRPLPPELVWHLKGMGLDPLDRFPESLHAPTSAGLCEWGAGGRGAGGVGDSARFPARGPASLCAALTGPGQAPMPRRRPSAGPAEVRAGPALGCEDALGLARALSMLGGGYTPVALRLLKASTPARAG